MILDELTNTAQWSSDSEQGIDSFYKDNNFNNDVALFKDHYDDTNNNYKADNILIKNGWNRVGIGHFSNAYEKDGYDYILKINRSLDSAFAKFALFSRLSHNIHFPVIGNAKIIRIGKEKYYCYLIEKLYSIPSMKNRQIRNIIEVLLSGNTDSFRAESFEELQDLAPYIPLGDREELVFKKLPRSFFEAITQLKEFSKKTGASLDVMNSGNIMQRKDGTVVFIDPFYFEGEI
jgi:hypothetical protein